MSRYIDADKMIADLLTVDPQYETMIRWCCDVTNAQPTADVVDVVRCKDCEFRFRGPDGKVCDILKFQMNNDDYCSFGSRKEQEHGDIKER